MGVGSGVVGVGWGVVGWGGGVVGVGWGWGGVGVGWGWCGVIRQNVEQCTPKIPVFKTLLDILSFCSKTKKSNTKRSSPSNVKFTFVYTWKRKLSNNNKSFR